MLGEALEADAALVELPDRLDQVLERASEPIKLPDDERVSFAGVRQRLL